MGTNDTSEFLELLVRCDALTFGDFVGKAGRPTPYFVNAGRVRTGAQIARLGEFYAAAVVENFGHDVDVLFGPAYKGIPLAVTTAIALHTHHGRDVGYCFDRKEAKDHGEGGRLVGHELADGDRVVLVEDVTTAGTSIRGVVPILREAADVELRGIVVGVDRRERGSTREVSALDELAAELDTTVVSLATIDDVLDHLVGREIDGRVVLGDEEARRVEEHRAAYGAG